MNIKNNLDNRICDCEPDAENTETYRGYIINTFKTLGMEEPNLDNYTNEELKQCLSICNDLWIS